MSSDYEANHYADEANLMALERDELREQVDRLRTALRDLTVTISALRPTMKLADEEQWARLEEAHNQACRAAGEAKP